jgi:hypothetical protein
MPHYAQVSYELKKEGGTEKWRFAVLPAIQPAPKRNSANRSISFLQNPGPIADERCLEVTADSLNRNHTEIHIFCDAMRSNFFATAVRSS